MIVARDADQSIDSRLHESLCVATVLKKLKQVSWSTEHSRNELEVIEPN